MRNVFRLVLLASCSIGLVGCGEDKHGTRESPAAPGFVGTWVLDSERAAREAEPTWRTSPEMAELPAEARDRLIRERGKGMRDTHVEYRFAADGTFAMTQSIGGGASSDITGTWVLQDGKYSVTEVTKNGTTRPPQDPHNTLVLELVSNDISFRPDGAPIAIVLHLVRR